MEGKVELLKGVEDLVDQCLKELKFDDARKNLSEIKTVLKSAQAVLKEDGEVEVSENEKKQIMEERDGFNALLLQRDEIGKKIGFAQVQKELVRDTEPVYLGQMEVLNSIMKAGFFDEMAENRKMDEKLAKEAGKALEHLFGDKIGLFRSVAKDLLNNGNAFF